ncbi:hypothetical protein ACWFNE_06445 [Cellulomonas sp. NPDC055163]
MSQLLSEIDRQLSEQRAQADAYATRAGVLVAATALLVGLIGTGAAGNGTDAPERLLIITIAGSAILGVVVLGLARLVLGPSPSQLARWNSGSIQDVALLESAKLVALEANTRAMARTEMVFFLQAACTVGSILLAVNALGSRGGA